MPNDETKIPGVKSTRLTKEEILIKTKLLVKMETMTMRRGLFSSLTPPDIAKWNRLIGLEEKSEILRERGVALLLDRDKETGHLASYVLLDDQSVLRAMDFPESEDALKQWGGMWQFLLDLPRVQIG